MSLDLGSNDIMLEGSSSLFDALREHPTITALTISNHDRFNRNRIGVKACRNLAGMLRDNKVLSLLNIADNRTGNDGLALIAPALTSASPLVVLNLANNELDDKSIDLLHNYLSTGKILLELNLSNNSICDSGIQKITGLFAQNMCTVKRLFLKQIKMTIAGADSLFDSLKHNTHVEVLDLTGNDLSGAKIHMLQVLLWSNKDLRKLTLAKCHLGKEAAQAIGKGLERNLTLTELDLSGNLLPPDCLQDWSSKECHGLFCLHVLNLADNPKLGHSVVHVLQGLKNKSHRNVIKQP